jgi:hypothetical protein
VIKYQKIITSVGSSFLFAQQKGKNSNIYTHEKIVAAWDFPLRFFTLLKYLQQTPQNRVISCKFCAQRGAIRPRSMGLCRGAADMVCIVWFFTGTVSPEQKTIFPFFDAHNKSRGIPSESLGVKQKAALEPLNRDMRLTM